MEQVWGPVQRSPIWGTRRKAILFCRFQLVSCWAIFLHCCFVSLHLHSILFWYKTLQSKGSNCTSLLHEEFVGARVATRVSNMDKRHVREVQQIWRRRHNPGSVSFMGVTNWNVEDFMVYGYRASCVWDGHGVGRGEGISAGASGHGMEEGEGKSVTSWHPKALA